MHFTIAKRFANLLGSTAPRIGTGCNDPEALQRSVVGYHGADTCLMFMIPGQVAIHFFVPEASFRESCLTAAEIDRACRFRFDRDAIHWMSCRARLRMTLGRILDLSPEAVPIVISNWGKPLLAPPYAGLHFNLTHCTELAMIVLSMDGPVGIDLERKCRGAKLLGCESTFCHPQEIEDLPSDSHLRAAQLLQIWTHKEAVLKALGTGLSHPPEQVRILFNTPFGQAISARPLSGINGQLLQTLSHPMLDGFQAVVSVPTTAKSVSISGRAPVPYHQELLGCEEGALSITSAPH